jgi:hypothetical protein
LSLLRGEWREGVRNHVPHQNAMADADRAATLIVNARCLKD